jgi:hypothetical protein
MFSHFTPFGAFLIDYGKEQKNTAEAVLFMWKRKVLLRLFFPGIDGGIFIRRYLIVIVLWVAIFYLVGIVVDLRIIFLVLVAQRAEGEFWF